MWMSSFTAGSPEISIYPAFDEAARVALGPWLFLLHVYVISHTMASHTGRWELADLAKTKKKVKHPPSQYG